MATLRKKASLVLGLVLAFAMVETVEAQQRPSRNQYSARRVTMPRGTLRLDLGPPERGINESGILLGPYDESAYGLRVTHYDNGDDVTGQLGMGIAYGVVDTLEIGVLAVPLNFARDRVYGDLAGYVRWAFVNTPHFQMGLQGMFQVPTWSHPGFGVGLPININAGRVVRIETGVKLETVFDDVDRDGDGDEEVRLAIDLPISLAVNVTRNGFLGPRADLLWDTRIGDAKAFRAGVGAFGGYSVLTRRVPYVDLTAQMMGYFKAQIFDWEMVLGATIAFGL